MSFEQKILTVETLAVWRNTLRHQGKKLVVTNGCFDLLHLGHVTYLQAARDHGDALLVGLDPDVNVRRLKGSSRPVNGEADRAGVLAALESVSGVFIFTGMDARGFLELAQPDIYVKGGDYTLDTLNKEERRVLEKIGAKIVLLPFVPGKSTTGTLEKISRL